ncbi:MAG: BPL-N domain-containing protein [Halobacteriota archaeon]|nr:BPL-N domain-containing protein [Halobacteriota archaeon]
MDSPRIGVYVGNGASHSWIWFVDSFERYGLYDMVFLTEDDISGSLGDIDILAIGGGDTYTIAGSLGPDRLAKISDFIKEGGFYIGTCAGAYLPLKSSKDMLSWFNVVEARINNLAKTLPEPKRMKDKYCVSYGCDLIYHPVRGPLVVKMNGRSVVAPLYGGPPMIASDGVEELAYYEDFTDGTVFLVDYDIAKETLFGKAAVLRKTYGSGLLYLYGPHFEHPQYPEANEEMLRAIRENISVERKRKDLGEVCTFDKEWVKELRREISNARIAANGIMMSPTTWKIGHKIWEPEKFSYFLDAIWKRLGYLKENASSEPGGPQEMIKRSEEATLHLRELKRRLKGEDDTTDLAEEAFANLRLLTSEFLDLYLGCKSKKEA